MSPRSVEIKIRAGGIDRHTNKFGCFAIERPFPRIAGNFFNRGTPGRVPAFQDVKSCIVPRSDIKGALYKCNLRPYEGFLPSRLRSDT